MTQSIALFRPVHAMNAEQRQTAADLWTKPTDLSRRPACRQLGTHIHHRRRQSYCNNKKAYFSDPSCMLTYWPTLYICADHHSEGAVNSYTTGTEMKDTYRADVDVQHLSCCRPESIYHPDKLQTCIVCHYDAGKPHGTSCPMVLYRRPDKPIVEHPYTGPRPAVKECSEYNVSKPCTRFFKAALLPRTIYCVLCALIVLLGTYRPIQIICN